MAIWPTQSANIRRWLIRRKLFKAGEIIAWRRPVGGLGHENAGLGGKQIDVFEGACSDRHPAGHQRDFGCDLGSATGAKRAMHGMAATTA